MRLPFGQLTLDAADFITLSHSALNLVVTADSFRFQESQICRAISQRILALRDEQPDHRSRCAAPRQRGQLSRAARVPPVKIGSSGINHPARPNEDINKLHAKGVTMFAVRDDLEERGIHSANCIGEVQMIQRTDVALLMDDYQQIWHW